MDREMEAVKSAILASGSDDWVHIAEVVSVARQARSAALSGEDRSDDTNEIVDGVGQLRSEQLAQSEREVLPGGIAAVKELLRDGLIRIGETSSSGFVPWDGSLGEIESRIDRAVQAARYPLLPGDLFWIESTPSGDEIARSR